MSLFPEDEYLNFPDEEEPVAQQQPLQQRAQQPAQQEDNSSDESEDEQPPARTRCRGLARGRSSVRSSDLAARQEYTLCEDGSICLQQFNITKNTVLGRLRQENCRHDLRHTDGQRRCFLCRFAKKKTGNNEMIICKTMYCCEQCRLPLCFDGKGQDCYTLYHSHRTEQQLIAMFRQ